MDRKRTRREFTDRAAFFEATTAYLFANLVPGVAVSAAPSVLHRTDAAGPQTFAATVLATFDPVHSSRTPRARLLAP